MSIPPLVCNTPPPPEQCDDVKLPEDFGIPYSLSQDEDDGINYNYDDFCEFEDYQTSNLTHKHISSIGSASQDQNVLNIQSIPPDPYLPPDYIKNDPYLPSDTATNNETTHPHNSEKTGFPFTKCDEIECSVVSGSTKSRIDEDNNIEDLGLEFNDSQASTKENTPDTEKGDKACIKKYNSPSISLSKKVPPHSFNEDVNISKEDTVATSVNVQNSSKSDPIPEAQTSVPEFTTHIPGLDQDDDFDDFNFVTTKMNLEDEVMGDLALKSNVTDSQFTLESSSNDDSPYTNEASTSHIDTIVNSDIHSEIETNTGVLAGNINDEAATETREVLSTTKEISNELEILQQVDTIATEDDKSNVENKISEDEFCEFDSFQYPPTKEDSPNIEVLSIENPWEQQNNVVDDSFTAFQANFDESHSKSQTVSEFSKKDKDKVDEEDDFGDFDDFKSSNNESNAEDIQQLPAFEFNSNDSENQIIESIERAIESLYEKQLQEPTDKLDSKLESSLCETWMYLRETEVRQPYMLNWNSSLGQKTLLKSLCIDSRNILFAPKWNHNMPKYAANLSTAPLQPMKQTATSSCETSNEKPGTLRPVDTWAETNNASDGQESCNEDSTTDVASSAQFHETSVFDQQTTNDRNYPKTLNIPAVRQINLPDTHIFTPTDSEIPRSKTIHYDYVAPVTIPQASDATKELEQDIEYADFQNFQASKNDNTEGNNGKTVRNFGNVQQTSKENLATGAFTSQSILQPVKVEPTMPTLDWPDPGQVKETYDDFSDFVSNCSWANTAISEPQKIESVASNITANSTRIEPSLVSNQMPQNTSVFGTNLSSPQTSGVPHSIILPTPVTEDIGKIPNANDDDDFDNFQFVAPETKRKEETHFPITSTLKPMEPSPAFNFTASPILQPTSFDRSNHTPQNTGQILQPLSLESFSQINWPSPGVDLQDLSRFNPIDSVHTLNIEAKPQTQSKHASPVHSNKSQASDDDGWGDFVSMKPQNPAPSQVDDADDWSDFVCSPNVKPQNGLNTISWNVHTNTNAQKPQNRVKLDSKSMDMPSLNYITPKATNSRLHSDRHLNL